MKIIGNNLKFGQNCIIEDNVIIGNNVILGNNVTLKSGTRVGDGVKMGDYCCTTGLCIIGPHVDIRTKATISKGLIIEDYAFVGPGVMTNHTKVVIPGVATPQFITRVGAGAVIGSQSIVLAGANIVSGAVIGAGSLVTKPITKPAVYCGSPVKYHSELPYKNKYGVTEKYTFTRTDIEKYLPNYYV